MERITNALTEALRGIWEYNPKTGEFLWKVRPSIRSAYRVGDRVGSVYPSGYRYLCWKGRDYRAARVAWFFATGEDPQGFIDHINGDKDDNRIANLRIADDRQNQANAFWSTNTSGVKGVRFDKGKWQAMITREGKNIYLGRFDSIVDAAMAYKRAAIEAWGEFALVPTDSEIEALGEQLERVKDGC